MIIQESIFSKEECDTIINYNKKNLQNWEYNDRKYFSELLRYNDETHWVFEKLKNFFNKKLDNVKIIKLNEEIHFHHYLKNHYFNKHNDVNYKRQYGVGVLLNDNFIGGDFNFFDNELTQLNKTIGNAYIFDVNIYHEITPITEGERFSLLWFLQDEHLKFKIEKLL